MDTSQRVPAFISYLLPVIGPLYVVLFKRKDAYAIFHARQSLGLVLFLIATFAAWAVFSYILAFIPFAAVLGVALFTIVIVAVLYGVILWIIGMLNALNGRVVLMPIFGRLANSLPL